MESRIIEALDQGKIVLVTGTRGVGKTTLLRSVEKMLARPTAFQDLEDPRFAPRPRKETLELFARESAYVLLDEVGRVDGWLDWARIVQKRQGARVVASLSGPRINIDAKDVVEVTLYPMSFSDYLTKKAGTPVSIESYLRGGGLPASNLVDLFNMCLFKDVVQRYEVRDIDKLTAIAVYLLASTSRQVSATRIKGLLSRSVDQARGFLAHLERSGLVYLVPRIEDGRRSRAQAARRCFSVDCGLSVALSNKELDTRDLAETAVFHELLRQGHTIQAWRARGRLGLAVAGSSGPRLLIDVSYQDKTGTRPRALASAMAAHSCRFGLQLGDDQDQGSVEAQAGTIVKRSFSDWLKSPDLPGISSSVKVAKKKELPEPEDAPQLPAYLL